MDLEIHEKSPYRRLANDSITPFKTPDGGYFKSVSHAYYYYMFGGDINIRNIIRTTESLEKIKSVIGSEKYSTLCKASRHIRKYKINKTIDLMKYLLLAKLNTHPDCVDLLMATWGRNLVVINDSDNVLGAGKARMGVNLTGLILMELRKSFQTLRHQEYLSSLITNYRVDYNSAEIDSTTSNVGVILNE
jgi:predicted NAD-dependent protein-ADP-ribosyltransferase YbiA (DUF1768 family)